MKVPTKISENQSEGGDLRGRRVRPPACLLIVIAAYLVAACATSPRVTRDGFVLSIDDYGPIAIVDDIDAPYNRVGRVEARRLNSGNVDLYVNSDSPAVYIGRESFGTDNGARYENTFYRLHFERVPYSLFPFHLTAGRNGGLFVVITRDEAGTPLLVTTVHTCGCYLAFVPTSALPAEALPAQWPQAQQDVYGETLPARLELPNDGKSHRIAIYLRSGTHRVRDIAVVREDMLTDYTLQRTDQLTIDSLLEIPLPNGEPVSFFEESGSRRGYVKYAVKPFEFLLMSWWALDLRVGQDKRLGDPQETGTVFYTSLKPWKRDESNLWPFDQFLRFWGWQL